MFRPQVNIKIGDRGFKYVTQLNVSSSWDKFTDTGTIIIPTKVKKDGETIFIGADNVFHKGDAVTIDAGYFPKSERIYTGFVSRIFPDIPLKIMLEDASWVLKQTNVTFALKSCSLKTMLETAMSKAKEKATGNIKTALSDIKLEVVDAQLGSFRVTNVNLVQILEELKKTYALTSFFRDNTLHVGLAYSGTPTTHRFIFEQTIIENNLEYSKEDDVKIKVKAVSMQPDNTKIEVEVGDEGGEQRTLFKYGLSKSELTAVANREKDKFKYEGWRGSFKTFLTAVVKHGDIVELINKRLPEWNGSYLVDAVDIEGGTGGEFQTITLGAKVSTSSNNF